MKAAPLALLLVCAPAAADVAVPQATAKSWHEGCAARIDATAKRLGLSPSATVTRTPLVREDGTPNGLTYVELGSDELTVTVGEDSDRRSDSTWSALDDCLKMGESK